MAENVNSIFGKGFEYELRVITEFLEQRASGTVAGSVGGANWGPVGSPTVNSRGRRQFRDTFGVPIDANDGADSSALALDYHLDGNSPRAVFTRITDGTDVNASREILVNALSGQATGTSRSDNLETVIYDATDGNLQNNRFKVDVDGATQDLTLSTSVSPRAAAITSADLSGFTATPATGDYAVNDTISFRIDGTTYTYVVQAADAFTTLSTTIPAPNTTYAEAWIDAANTLILDTATFPERAGILTTSGDRVVFNSINRGSASNIAINTIPKIFSSIPDGTIGSNTSSFDILNEIDLLLDPVANAFFDASGQAAIASTSTGVTSTIELKGIPGSLTDDNIGTADGSSALLGSLGAANLSSVSALTVKWYEPSTSTSVAAEQIATGDAVQEVFSGTLTNAPLDIGTALALNWTDTTSVARSATITVDATGTGTIGGADAGLVSDFTVNIMSGAFTLTFAAGSGIPNDNTVPGEEIVSLDYDYFTARTTEAVTVDTAGAITGTNVTGNAITFETGVVDLEFNAGFEAAAGTTVLVDATFEGTSNTPYALLSLATLVDTEFAGQDAVAAGELVAAFSGTRGNTIQMIVEETEDGTNASIVFDGTIADKFFVISFDTSASNYLGNLINTSQFLTNIVSWNDPASGNPNIPAGTYTLSGGTSGVAGLTDNDYVLALDEFKSIKLYDVDIVFVGGSTSEPVADKIQEVCEFRQDCFGIVDPPFGINVGAVINWHNGTDPLLRSKALDSAYISTYYPHMLVPVETSGTSQWHGPTVRVVGAIAQGDKSTGVPLGAPAGLKTSMRDIDDLEIILRADQSATLYADQLGNNINPVEFSIVNGFTIEGQKTTQKTQNALNRLNPLRSSIYIKKNIERNIAQFFWRPSNSTTWKEFAAYITNIMQVLADAEVIEPDFIVKCDRQTNTDEVIAANGLLALIEWRPIKSIEKIKVISSIFDTQVNLELV